MRIGWLLLLPTLASANDAATAVIARHCISCHGAEEQKADLRLDDLSRDFSKPEVREQWAAVLARVTAGTMPPAKKPKLNHAEKEALLNWIGGELAAVERAKWKAEGRAGLRRLNRREYENTIRDLLGVDVEVAKLLPEDAVSHGFDNLGETLNLSSVHLQRYLQAADTALNASITSGPKPEAITKTYTYAEGRGSENIGKHWLKRPDGAVVFFSSGTFPSTHLFGFRVDQPGKYRIRIHGYSHQSKMPVPFALYLGNLFRGGDVETHGFYELPVGKTGIVEVTAPLERGDSLQILPSGLKGFNQFKPKDPDRTDTYTGPGLAILKVEITGPIVDEWPSRGHKLLFGDLPLKPIAPVKGKQPQKGSNQLEVISQNPTADAKRLLLQFFGKASRRPATVKQIEPYFKLFELEMKNGASFAEALKAAAAAILCSTDFLFYREKPGKLDDYALATRLSYFLWRTMPDEELLKLAEANKLREPAVLKAQTERLLTHANTRRFSKDFTDAWLDLRNIDFTVPDKVLYPEYDELLKHSMLEETQSYFEHVLKLNKPAKDFLASDYAMLNARLAEHYGIPGVEGLAIRPVPVTPSMHRGGLLTQAALLKVSANGTNTSPVVRGVYVLERFLGVIPPPPPPGVPAVEPDIRGAKTVRELLDKHRNTENCAGCHKLIDPPGFALEEYDVIGGHRTKFRTLSTQGPPAKPGVRYKNGPAVDAAGELTDGRRFQDFPEFQKLLLAEPDRFAECLAGKLIAFATGKEAGTAEKPMIRKILQDSKTREYPVRDMIHAVVQSELFREK